MLLLVHGGAGVFASHFTPQRDAACRAGLRAALRSGWAALRAGSSALDACCKAVCCLEDDPNFNAGRGSTFHLKRGLEMEATVMRGSDRACGAITSLWGPRNPVLAARAVMEKTPHVFLAGAGAMEFCQQQGLEMMPQEWFEVAERLQALEKALSQPVPPLSGSGTVGAVALDAQGQLAAATSTGGMNAKIYGRVGDSACAGAGTWADTRSCAVSCTGHGESFIRFAASHELDARIRLGGQNLLQAATDIIAELGQIGGMGGLITLGPDGRFAMPFNCEGMLRGMIDERETPLVAIFREGLAPV